MSKSLEVVILTVMGWLLFIFSIPVTQIISGLQWSVGSFMNEYMNKQSEMGTYGGANVLYLW